MALATLHDPPPSFPHRLTNNGRTYHLRVEMTDADGNLRIAEYDSFRVKTEGGKGARLCVASVRAVFISVARRVI